MSPVSTRDRGDGGQLAAYLGGRRWFGGKGRAIVDASLEDVIPVTWPGATREFHVARVRVTTAEGTERYQLFLEDARATRDALENPEFTRGLVDAFRAGARFERDGVSWVIASESATPLVVPARERVALSGAEQTNSSIIVGQEAILKLYRRLEPGIHPDVEVTRFLTIDRGFAHVPALLGTIRFEDAGGVTIAGMLQELVPEAADGWTYALDCGAKYFGASTRTGERAVPFAEEAHRLGVVTRALHETLASGDPGTPFELRAATEDDAFRWTRGAREMIERALASLERALADDPPRIPPPQRAAAASLLQRRQRYLGWLDELASGIAADAGANTRTHGDYHLGQVLRSSAGAFLVIDFEGEPARPLEERRARHSPLRDVAGMVRSFAYAAAVASGRHEGEGSSAGTASTTASPTTAARALRWETALRDAFLRGYFSEKHGNPALLPRSQSNAGRLIALFEAEKLFYELQYEIDHRPDWVWIPLAGIAKLHT